jgi:hypothetical protein
MTSSLLGPIRDQLERIVAQGAQLTPPTAFGTLARACATAGLAPPAALLEQIQQQATQGRLDRLAADSLVKVVQTIKQAEILTSAPDRVEVSALQALSPERSVYLARDQITPADSARPDDILALANPFARAAQTAQYLRRASLDELRASIDMFWFDYALLPAICDGLAARPDAALHTAALAIRSNNPVTQRVALAVFASLRHYDDYRGPAVDLLRERVQRTKEPLKYLVMETMAALDETLPAYHLAQQTFFDDHAAAVRQLVSPKKSERRKGLKALARTKHPGFAPAILALFADPELATEAIEASVNVGAFAAIPRLTHMLGASHQAQAALALYRFGDRQGLEYFLRRALSHPFERPVTFDGFAHLLPHPTLRILREVANLAECARGCREVFGLVRSRAFAACVWREVERDPTLADRLAPAIQAASPAEYAASLPPDSGATSDKRARALIMAALGPNPHTIVTTLKNRDEFHAILVRPNGRQMITVTVRGEVSIWDCATWKKSTALTLPGWWHRFACQPVVLSADGQHLLVANRQAKAVEIYACDRGDRPVGVLELADDVVGVGMTADGRYVLQGASEGVTVWTWDTSSPRVIARLAGHQHGVEMLTTVPGRPLVITGDRQGTLHVWEQETWTRVVTLQVKNLVAASAACSPDGRYLVVIDTLGTYLETRARAWDTETWAEVAGFAIPGSAPVTCFTFTPDSRYLIAGANDLIFLEVGAWRDVLTLRNPDTRALAVLPDGAHLIAGRNVWKLDRTKLP